MDDWKSGNITDGDRVMTLTSNLSPLNCHCARLVEGDVINEGHGSVVINAPSGRTRRHSL